jgi:hypothetical protein
MSEAKGPPLRGLFRFARQRSAEHHSLGRRLQAWVVRHTFDRFKISMSMTPQSAVSVELEEFLREQVGLHATDKVNPADRLEDDLHITGDDAADLIEASRGSTSKTGILYFRGILTRKDTTCSSCSNVASGRRHSRSRKNH